MRHQQQAYLPVRQLQPGAELLMINALYHSSQRLIAATSVIVNTNGRNFMGRAISGRVVATSATFAVGIGGAPK